ncbi:hypothetical protein [Trabulsiella odontotermitis]|uniref:hypothetical protein n=1 Tax=Trabulsiella odontotermitis TaxID=379893 RepID=UPI000675E184|nr:hypothetical protein [Trabulsiella odontotermitis]KNC91277.1 hypothetical protein GM30_23415 [Trabulsiella odontotermitis]
MGTAVQEDILRYVRAVLQDAERLAYDMAHSRSDIRYDLTESIKTNKMEDIILILIGEKVGDDYKRQLSRAHRKSMRSGCKLQP